MTQKFEYASEVLNDEIRRIYSILRGVPTPDRKEKIKYNFAILDLTEAIKILQKEGSK